MKLCDRLLLGALLAPTVLVVVAAVISLAAPVPAPEYHAPVAVASGSALYPADLPLDIDPHR